MQPVVRFQNDEIDISKASIALQSVALHAPSTKEVVSFEAHSEQLPPQKLQILVPSDFQRIHGV